MCSQSRDKQREVLLDPVIVERVKVKPESEETNWKKSDLSGSNIQVFPFDSQTSRQIAAC
jgi:hypothetical protein